MEYPRVSHLYTQLKESPIFFVLGANVIESEDSCTYIAEQVKKCSKDIPVPIIFKASFDKANRTECSGFRGVGLEDGLKILQHVKEKTNLPVLTDIHEPWQANVVAEVADVIQIPAFLCRQTDLIKAAAKTNKIVNIKKGQWCSTDVADAASRKANHFGNREVIICERGTHFGYHDLFVDMTNFGRLRASGHMVLFDATHASQKPGMRCQDGTVASGGTSRYIATLCKAAIAAGAHGLFIEVHPNPADAPVDGACQVCLDELPVLLHELTKLARLMNDVEPNFLPNEPRGLQTLEYMCDQFEFTTLLDIGSGMGYHSKLFQEKGKQVTACDIGISPNYQHGLAIEGDYLKITFEEQFDAIWCCHVLEHQRNPGVFLDKIFADLKEGGILAITVPTKKGNLVGGHVTLWNAGLLLYNLILARFDCRMACVASYGYNISVIVKKSSILSFPQIGHDKGDIEILKGYFPPESDAKQGMDGDIWSINWENPRSLPVPRLFL